MRDAHKNFSRRDWLALNALAAGAFTATRAPAAPQSAAPAPAAPVSVAKVRTYDEDLVAQFRKMFDEIGGIGDKVRGKTVAIKLNLTGANRFEGYTAGDTHWVHPKVVGAVTAVLGQLGAKRVRLLESCFGRRREARLEDKLLSGGWDVNALKNAAPVVEFEDTDTNQAQPYGTFKVAHKPYVFPAFNLNHSYHDCDYFISLGKMKNHEEMGVTMSIKNMFGVTPTALYGGRERIFHYGRRRPPAPPPRSIPRATATKAGACRAFWWTSSVRGRLIWRLSTASSALSAARARGCSAPGRSSRESWWSATTA